MTTQKAIIGPHVATGWRTGFNFVRPFSRGMTTFLLDALFEVEADGTVHYNDETHVVFRPVGVYCWPPGSSNCELDIMPGFNDLQVSDMEAQAIYWWPLLRDNAVAEQDRLERALGIRPRIDALKLTNEVGGNDPEDILKLITYERALCLLAKADDWKITVGNNAGNSPHFDPLWKDLYAPFIRWAWSEEAGRHYYQRHVYFDLRPYDENWSRLFTEIAYLRGLGETGPIVCSELGYATYPGTAVFMQNVKAWNEQALAYSEIGHADCFSYGDDWNNGQADISPASEQLGAYLQANMFERWRPSWPDEDTDPPNAYRVIVTKTPQPAEYSKDEFMRIQDEHVFPNGRSQTASDDDALRLISNPDAKPDSYVEIYRPELPSQVKTINLLESAGYAWKELTLDSSNNPLEGLRLGTVFRVPYVLTSPFNAPRPYGNGLHEGADYDVIGTDLDSKEPVLALYDGRVTRAEINPSSGYHTFVVIRHERHGSEFFTWYAHLDAIYIGVDDPVFQGDQIGEVGQTGNANGEHVHVNLQVPGYGLSGYVVPDVVDPHPYIEMNVSPPVGDLVDVASYQLADRYAWRVVRHPDGRQEDIQDMPLGESLFVRRKNTLGEWWSIGVEGAYLFHDTSPAPDSQGTERVYTLYKDGIPGAKKNPLEMRIGETWNESGSHIVQFRAKENCWLLDENSGSAQNAATLVARERPYTFNAYGQNLTLDDVIFVKTGVETQIYAKHDGRVVGWCGWLAPWGESEIVELHWDRGIMIQEPDRFCNWE